MITSVLTAPPANARMSVCVIVPIMSQPTDIPRLEELAHRERRAGGVKLALVRRDRHGDVHHHAEREMRFPGTGAKTSTLLNFALSRHFDLLTVKAGHAPTTEHAGKASTITWLRPTA